MADLIQTRRDTYDNWWSVNPTLANGEVGIITHASGSGNATPLNPLQCKVGDGSTNWRNLATQAWAEPGLSGSINQRINQVSGSLHTEVSLMSGSLESLEDNIGHYTCRDQGNIVAKTVSALNYTRITGGAFKVKFTYKHTATSGTVTLKVGNAAAANLYYDGAPVTNLNTWEAGETVDVYFDGQYYMANNVSGGGTFATGEKVDNVGIDSEPTAGSDNLVKSGGVAKIGQNVINVHTYNNHPTSYEDRNAARTTIPISLRKHGVALLYVSTVDSAMLLEFYSQTSTSDTDWLNDLYWDTYRIIPENRRDILFNVNTFLNKGVNAEYSLLEAITSVPAEYRNLARVVVYRDSSTHEACIAIFNAKAYNTQDTWENIDNWYTIDRTVLTDITSLKTSIGTLTNLDTETKTNIVSAINEIVHEIGVLEGNIKNLQILLKDVYGKGQTLEYTNQTSAAQLNYDGSLKTNTGNSYEVNTYSVVGIIGVYVTGRNLTSIVDSDKHPIAATYDTNGNVIDVIYKDTTDNYDDLFVPISSNAVTIKVQGYGAKRVGCKKIKTLENLSTTDKTSIIAAINELANSQPSIDIEQIVTSGEELAKINNTSIFAPKSVPLCYGISEAGKILQVGSDGNVTIGDGTGSPEDVSSCVRKRESKTIYLGQDLLSGVTGSGTGWTNNNGVYTHTSGSTDDLIFPVNTTSGKRYIVKVTKGVAGVEDTIRVAVGDSPYVDTYWSGTGPDYFGIKSDGGQLKIKPESTYNSTVQVELREITTEELADTQINFVSNNVDNGSMISDITSKWCVAIGPNNLEKAQNVTRSISMGFNSMIKLESGNRNIGIGTFTMANAKEGDRNIAIGADSMMYPLSAYDCVAVGKATFDNSNNSYQDKIERNVAIGAYANARNTQLCHDNVAVGYGAGRFCDVYNVAIGSNAYGHCNYDSINSRPTGEGSGQGNVAIGYNSMKKTYVKGDNNIAIGHEAQIGTTGTSNNVQTINNSIAIGYNVQVNTSNTCSIGNTSITTFIFGGKKLVFNNDNTVTWETV